MKNIAAGGVLERIRKLAPQHVTAPYRTVDEWREWQLAEGRKRSEEINRQNRQIRVEKIMKRSGIQLLHQKCSFANYQVKNDGQRHALSQAKSIAEEMMTGCTNFVFSGKPGTGKNHLAAAIGNHLLAKGRSVIVVTVADVMLALHGNYDNKNSGEKFLQGLCEVDLLVLDEIGMQRDTRNEQVTL
ncbi:DNA replication protein DnaC, partial [Escherichia coli]|nr:DNA replication protein DnaC [Escherichia coli]EJF6670522.1 ATP-binding protein [Escherichia coli]